MKMHLPKLGVGMPTYPAPAACGADAMGSADTTVAQCDCQACLWVVYNFLQHQQNMVMGRLRAIAGVAIPVNRKGGG